MYVHFIDRTFRVNLEVNIACMPDDSINLITYNVCRTIPGVSLTSEIFDNGRNNSMAEEPIVKLIREARFHEWL